MDDGNSNLKRQVILLFDACMHRLKNCRENNSCEKNESYFCRHRFNFEGHFFYAHGLDKEGKISRKGGASDFDVILYFFEGIILKRAWWPDTKNQDRVYVLVTKDPNFLEHALSDSKINEHPEIKFNGRMVERNGIKIFVEILKCNNSRDKQAARIINCCIEKLNEKWSC